MNRFKPPNHVTEFILLGLTQNPHLQQILFIVFSFIFLFIALANLLIVTTISFSPTLSTPIYFFLTYLSFTDASYMSITTPKMIIDLLYQRRTISFSSCLTQLFVEHFLGGSEIILLIVMACDRYVAICKPHTLHVHHVTMTLTPPGDGAGLGGYCMPLYRFFSCSTLPVCGPNVIAHFVCDLFPLLQLACSDTYRLRMVVAANSGAMCFLIFPMLFASCVVILNSLKSHGSEAR